MKKIILFILRFYKKYISPAVTGLFGGGCRFTPTCSEYTMEAVEKYGSARGVVLGLKRFFRCNPLFKGGYDPVPDINKK